MNRPPHPPGVINRIPPTALLDLGRLAMLREVAYRGSFAAAAEALAFTPSAVSQQMTALARDVGVNLFERTPRGMRPTDSAHALVAHCERAFACLSDAQAELDAIAGGISGRLRLGSFPTATVAFAARALETFQTRHPHVDITFADGEPYESVLRLKQRELDLAVLFDFDHWPAGTDYDGRAVCADVEITCAALFEDPFHLVIPAGHPLAACEQVELKQLEGELVIGSPSRCSPWGADLEHLCSQVGFVPEYESCYRTVDFPALQAIVATGRGVTLVPALALATAHPGTVVRPLRGGPARHVAIATLAGTAASPARDAMIAALREAVAALPEATAHAPQRVAV